MILKHGCEWNLFPEGFANVGVLFADVACHQKAVVGQGQRHVQRVVACVHSCGETTFKSERLTATEEPKWTPLITLCTLLFRHRHRVYMNTSKKTNAEAIQVKWIYVYIVIRHHYVTIFYPSKLYLTFPSIITLSCLFGTHCLYTAYTDCCH